ncbi:MAG: GxxExxY protein [Balneolaceae bacterium]
MERENRLATKVLDCAFQVHRNLGPGLLESAYQMALEAEFIEQSVPFISQNEVPLEYKGRFLETAYRMDFLVGNALILEIKSVEAIHDVHLAQVLTYLKLSDNRLGY